MLILPALVLGGCPGFGARTPGSGTTEVPENPNYVDHAGPVLDAYCAPCHTAPPSGGAPDYFRLDQYDGDGTVDGAFAMADRVAARAAGDSPTMPPSYATQPTDIDREILAGWVDDGAPYAADTGGGE